MDTRAVTTSSVRVGWFDKDPLKVPAANDGNFISSTDAGANAPVDSFMVYVASPVNDFGCRYSDGTIRIVPDPLRRWFSEVVALDRPYQEVLSVAGVHEAQTFSISLPGGPGSLIQGILDGQGLGNGGLVRLVFRIKTNRGYDDGDYGVHQNFSSGTAGAAIVDDVVATNSDPGDGDFELASAIDNLASPQNAWHATGKPPGIYFHTHSVTGLPFADPCGATTSPSRQCNLSGRIVTPGDHDQLEKPGGVYGTAFQDRHDLLGSPTINLRSSGPGLYNGQGIDTEIADVTGDWNLLCDLYTGGLKGSVNGNYWQVGWQSYPARQANGLKVWGEIRMPSTVSSFAGTQCITSISRGARFDGCIVTSNANGIPDSMRVYIQHLSRCFSLPIAGAQCSPSTGTNVGIYMDNVALAFIDTPSPPAISANPWDLFSDTFPTNDDPNLPGVPLAGGIALDTCAAQVRTALNLAQSAGLARHAVPGDSALVSAAGDGIRIDMVFRVLPGVGNYVAIGNRSSGVAKRPDHSPRLLAVPEDGSFWGSYLDDNGVFGTGAPMNGVTRGPGHPGGAWDPNRWNSARCDTAELNLFPESGGHGNLSALKPGQWASMLHESDPKYAVLGIIKPRCFLITPGVGTPVDASNITCGGAGYPPPWTASPSSGFDPGEVNGLPGSTREFTSIIPDGQLTPGAHVEYFFRKSSLANPAQFSMAPDTTRIVPQAFDGNLDGRRWQEFSVLPDRWKDPAFGGAGLACLLFVDWSDRRGDEMDWVAVMDSIGGTAPSRWGAHNGWHARGDQDPTSGIDPLNGGDASMAVAAHRGQAGTVWDLYQLHGAESGSTAISFANRLANSASAGLVAGRLATSGPTPLMLRSFYRTLVISTGDLGAGGAGVFGPYAEKTDDDIAMLQGFAALPDGTPTPRAVWAIGRNLAESQSNGTTGHPGFIDQYFGATLRSTSFRNLSGSTKEVVDFVPSNVVDPLGTIYGMRSDCSIDADVLNVNSAVSGATIASRLDDPAAIANAPPFISGVYVPAGVSHPQISELDAFRLRNLGSRYSQARPGLLGYMLGAMTRLFAQINCGPLSTPVGVGDGPGSGAEWVAHLALRSENPLRHGDARIAFGLTRGERALVRVYDVGGRKIRTLADRTFAPGVEHVLLWDGTDDSGRRVEPGVYFYRLSTPSFTGERKLTILR